MKFSEAIQAVIDAKGRKGMRLPNWLPGAMISYADPSIFEAVNEPRIYFVSSKQPKNLRPFHASTRYLLETNWELVDVVFPEDEVAEKVSP